MKMAAKRRLLVLTALLLASTSCGSGSHDNPAPAGTQETAVAAPTTQASATTKPESAVDSRDLTYDIKWSEGRHYRFLFRLSESWFPVTGNRDCDENGDPAPGRRYIRIPYSITNLHAERGAPVPLFGAELSRVDRKSAIALDPNTVFGCSEVKLRGQYSRDRGILPNGTMRGVLTGTAGGKTIDESAEYLFLFRLSTISTRGATITPDIVPVPLVVRNSDQPTTSLTMAQYLTLLRQGRIESATIIESEGRIVGRYDRGQYSVSVQPGEMSRVLSAIEDAGVRVERR